MIAHLLFCCLLGSIHSADILVVLPHTGKSHFDVFQPLLMELASRGHQLTVISFFPKENEIANYTDISFVGAFPVFVNALQFKHLVGMNPIIDFMTITGMGVQSCENILTFPPVNNLIHSTKTFDLLLIEMFNTDCFLGFVSRFNAPYIGISSSSIFPNHYARIGNFDNLAYFPNLFFPFNNRMTFVERTVNVVCTIGMRFVKTYYFSIPERRTLLNVFGREVPIQDIAHNVSLALVNSHHSLQGARPRVPGYIEVGGLHIHPAKPIDEELNDYLNEATEGALLFSMGSVLKSSSFPPDKRQAIMEAFAELPIRVIMKWENETLPGKPDNVKLSKWLPQRDILAHPKIVAFLGHGGLLSTSEAVHCGVPMVLIPMFGDQHNNVAHLEATGAAIKLPYSDITKDTVLKALQSVLYDTKYRDNAKSLSERFRDRPMSPLDTAVYWTEYVIRHKGAPHLRSPAVDMPWYQLWLLDVIFALLAVLTTLLLVVFWLAKRITMLVYHLFNSDRKHKKKD